MIIVLANVKSSKYREESVVFKLKYHRNQLSIIGYTVNDRALYKADFRPVLPENESNQRAVGCASQTSEVGRTRWNSVAELSLPDHLITDPDRS